MNKLIHGGMLLGLLTGCIFATTGCQRDTSADTPAAEAASSTEGTAEAATPGIVLSPASRALAELKVEPARVADVRNRKHTTGEIQVDGRHVARIVSRLPGWVEEVRRIKGDSVRRGDIVLTIYSPEYQTSESELLSARNRLETATTKGDKSEIATAQAIYDSARKRLLLFGETESELDELLQAGEVSPVVHVHSPFDGTILDATMVPGHRVEAGTEVCLISNLSTVWALLKIVESDLASIKVGAKATVKVSAYPGVIFPGTVAFVDNVLDEATRTVEVRVEVNNQDRRLKPGMFVDADIDISEAHQSLTVPVAALQQEGSTRFVFVATAAGFFRRDVKVGIESEDIVEIVAGVQAGDSVVTDGSFALKSEMLKSAFGEAGD